MQCPRRLEGLFARHPRGSLVEGDRNAPGARRPLTLLLVDSAAAGRAGILRALARADAAVTTRSTEAEALALLNQQSFDVVVCGSSLPAATAITFLQAIRIRDPIQPVVLIGELGAESAEEAERADAFVIGPADADVELPALIRAIDADVLPEALGDPPRRRP
jgi:DNA-binding NtrC family response regulator